MSSLSHQKLNKNIHMFMRRTSAACGAQKMVRQHAEILKRYSHQVTLFCEKGDVQWAQKNGIHLHTAFQWPISSFYARNFFSLQAQRSLNINKSYLSIGHGDTLHQNILFMHNCVHHAENLRPYSNESKNNVSARFHEEIFRRGSAQLVVCNSELMKRELSRAFHIIWPIEILYPGCDPDLAKKVEEKVVLELRQQWGIQSHPGINSEIVVGLVTSGDLKNRNAYLFLQSLGALPEKIRERLKIVIVGKEKRPEKLYELGLQVQLKKQQLFWLEPRPDVQNVIQAMDVIVHPAKSESFGMAVLEAMALGKPIISSQQVGCTEIFPNISRELVLPYPEKESITHLLYNLINQKEWMNKVGDENRRVALSYTWKRHETQFIQLINQVVEQNKKPTEYLWQQKNSF